MARAEAASSTVIASIENLPKTDAKPTTEQIKTLISHYALQYAVSAEIMNKVILGESNYRCDVYGDNFKAFGIAQFHRGTFDMFSKELGEKLDYYSCEDQIELFAWALSKGYGHHWTVWRNLK